MAQQCLVAFTQHNIVKVQPWCVMYQNFINFYGLSNIPHVKSAWLTYPPTYPPTDVWDATVWRVWLTLQTWVYAYLRESLFPILSSPGKALISPSVLNDSFTGYKTFGRQFFLLPFKKCHPLPPDLHSFGWKCSCLSPSVETPGVWGAASPSRSQGLSRPPSFQLDCSASRCGSLYTHPSRGSLSFLHVQILVFCQVCRVNGHSSFQHSLCPLFSCSKISMRCPSAQLMRPHEFLRTHVSSFSSWHWMTSSRLVSSLWILSSACSKSATGTL